MNLLSNQSGSNRIEQDLVGIITAQAVVFRVGLTEDSKTTVLEYLCATMLKSILNC